MPTSHPLNCDSHVHVFDPLRFAYASQRAYTPPSAKTHALEQGLKTWGCGRVVLVQASPYGTDNRCLLDALTVLGTQRARGVAVVDTEQITNNELHSMQSQGVRGIRLNLHVRGAGFGMDQSHALELVRQQIRSSKRVLQATGWHLQIHADGALIVAMLPELIALKAPVVFDHYAHAGMLDAEHLKSLLDAMCDQPFYVKLSAPHRVKCAPNDARFKLRELAQAFAHAVPDRILWGSDWPHTGGKHSPANLAHDPLAIEPFQSIDNTRVLQELLSCLPAKAAQKLLIDNPARLYGFDAI